jgi:hypothetical protein
MAGNSRTIITVFYASLAAMLLGTLVSWVIRGASGVHVPLLVAVASGLLLGFLDPKKGWAAALVQAGVVLLGVLFFRGDQAIPEIEIHSLVGSIGLTFAGSFVGAFIKRALDS